MFKIKVTKEQAINNAKKANEYCANLQVAIIKSMDILKQFNGKMINKKIVDAINTYFESVFTNILGHENIKCTVSLYDSCLGKCLRYHVGYLDLEGEGQNYCPFDSLLLKTNEKGKFDFDLTKQGEFKETMYRIIDFKKEFQEIAQNYDRYEKLVSNIYRAMKEYNEQRSEFICPYIPLISF